MNSKEYEETTMMKKMMMLFLSLHTEDGMFPRAEIIFDVPKLLEFLKHFLNSMKRRKMLAVGPLIL